LNDRCIDRSKNTGDNVSDEHAQHRGTDQTTHAGLVAGSEDKVRTTAYSQSYDDAAEDQCESRQRIQHADTHTVTQDEKECILRSKAERTAVYGCLDICIVGDVAYTLCNCPYTTIHAAEYAFSQLH